MVHNPIHSVGIEMSNPTCCGLESIWVDHGPKLQYFYCQECKKEVAQPPAPEGADRKNHLTGLLRTLIHQYDEGLKRATENQMLFGSSYIRVTPEGKVQTSIDGINWVGDAELLRQMKLDDLAYEIDDEDTGDETE